MAWPTTVIVLQTGATAPGAKIMNPELNMATGSRAVEDSDVPYAAGYAAGAAAGSPPTTGQLWPRGNA